VVNSRRALCELSHTRCGCPEITRVPLSYKYETGSSMLGANPNLDKSLYKALLVKDEMQVRRIFGAPNYQKCKNIG